MSGRDHLSSNKPSQLNMQAVLSMRDSGYYSQRTAGAKHAIDNTLPVMKRALDLLPESATLRFADFGAADGGTSAALWSQLVSELRASGDARPIEILYTDLPSNDFSTLFRTIQGMEGNPDDAYQTNNDDVFVHGSGTGFHRQLMASNSLNLGFSATAMHYVSQKPCEIKGHVHVVGAAENERTLFAAQAAADWRAILLARAAEMRKGSRLIILNFGIDEQGRYLGHTGGHSMFDKFASHWRALVKAGTITKEEFERATFVQHYRTVEEFRAPFDDENSHVRKAGLKLNSIQTRLTPCPYRKAYRQSDGKMSAIEFAASLIPTMRSWSETVFRSALNTRPIEEATKIVDAFYGSYEAEVAANPDGHAMDYIHAIMEIEKS